jgi:hypothetical protein
MEKSRDIYPVLLNLIEKLGSLYMEYINSRNLTNKLQLITASLVKGVTLLVLITMFSITIWSGLMLLIFQGSDNIMELSSIKNLYYRVPTLTQLRIVTCISAFLVQPTLT